MSADDFLLHFEQVFERATVNYDNPVNTPNVSDNILDSDINFKEVDDVVKKLKCNKACGIDNVIGELFSNSFDIIYPFVLKLFNVIFSTGIYPESWCTGVISPIFKKGNKDIADNYRGITLINIFPKIYSHVLNNRLLKWSQINEKIAKNQFGFQPIKSTINCLFIFHSIIANSLKMGINCIALSWIFRKLLTE